VVQALEFSLTLQPVQEPSEMRVKPSLSTEPRTPAVAVDGATWTLLAVELPDWEAHPARSANAEIRSKWEVFMVGSDLN
jgi:hypothetical protein